MLYFNPGCAMQLYKPQASQKIFALLKEHFPSISFHEICCHYDPKLPTGSQVITVCAGCDRRFSRLYEGISTLSLWQLLEKVENFPFPNYQGMTLTIHDPCPVRKKPEVHLAVRNLLAKMNIQVIEAKNHSENASCCGDIFYEKLPLSQVYALMEKRAQDMPCENVCVYCVSCIGAMNTGGKTPRHLLDLLLGEDTNPMSYDLETWHKHLSQYRVLHSK